MCFRFRKNFLNITDMSCFIAKSKHIIQKIAHSTNFQENIIGKSQDIIERLYMRITNIECGIQVSSPLFLFGSSILCQKTKRTCPELLKFIHHLRILIFLEIRSPNFALSCSLYNNVAMLRQLISFTIKLFLNIIASI